VWLFGVALFFKVIAGLPFCIAILKTICQSKTVKVNFVGYRVFPLSRFVG